jgi:5-hydroxyisourate hydrolase
MTPSLITTHVLDTALGRPAEGVSVTLHAITASGVEAIARATTDADGRALDLGPTRLAPGRYRLVFDTASYHADTDQPSFFPEVAITFTVADGTEHHHVPVLLSPYAYSTYRGS